MLKFKYSLKNELCIKVNVRQNENTLKYLIHFDEKNNKIMAIYHVRTSFTKTPYKRFETCNQYIQENDCRKINLL
jgi:hypothetical protein